jgi:hypothetical protein
MFATCGAKTVTTFAINPKFKVFKEIIMNNDLQLAEKFIESMTMHYCKSYETHSVAEQMAMKSGIGISMISTLCKFPGVRDWLCEEIKKTKGDL